MENKRLKLIDESVERDSFSDRIYDDLCEILVSYLKIDDRMGFECVSHQFKRCVYQKSVTLMITSKENNLISISSDWTNYLINLKTKHLTEKVF